MSRLEGLTRLGVALACVLALARPVRADDLSGPDFVSAIHALTGRFDEPVGLVATAKSPRLGLEKGDLVIAINGEPALQSVSGGADFSLNVDRAIQTLTVLRNKKELAISLHLKQAAATVHVQRSLVVEGKAYAPVMKNGVASGVLVADQWLAFLPGPIAGDVIRRIDGHLVTTGPDVASAYLAIRENHAKTQFTIDLERVGEPFQVTVELEDPDPAIASGIAAIKKVNDTAYEVPKILVDAMLKNPVATANGARFVPSVKDGKPDGFKIYAIRPASVFGALGLLNGDTLQALDGQDLTTIDKVRGAYTKLASATNVTLHIVRRGVKLTFSYTVK